MNIKFLVRWIFLPAINATVFSIFSLWPGHSKQAQKYHYQTVQLGCVIFETPKYESGTEGKYYPIPIQEIRRSPFRSLVRRSGLVTRKWVSRETSQRFP